MKTPPLALRPLVISCLLLAAAGSTWAQANRGQTFTCVAASGRNLTSDRLIADCMDREQRVLGRDGTLLYIVPPSLTLEERAEKEAREKRIAAEKEAKAEAVRRDRLLLQRYPDEGSHQKARDASLEAARAAQRESERRIAELSKERKALNEEAEFYKNKAMPPKLKQQIDANDGATAAQRDAVASQKAEMDRIAKRYDVEFAHLKRLWAGMVPGTVVALASDPEAVPAAAPGKATKPIKTTAATRQ